MKKILIISSVYILVFGFILLSAKEGFAKCEREFDEMKKAGSELTDAQNSLFKAKNKFNEATGRFDGTINYLWALARRMGATQGSVTRDKITLGAPQPKDKPVDLDRKPFYWDKAYKAAKNRWELDKIDYEDAKEKLSEAKKNEEAAVNKYKEAKAAYNKCMATHEPAREKPAKVLSLELPRLRWIIDDEQAVAAKDKKGDTEVGVSAKYKEEDTIKIEMVSDPPGILKLKDAKLTSPEGVIYTPSQKYDKKVVRLGRPVYTEGRPAADSSAAGAATGAAIGSALIGGFGSSGGGGESCAKPCEGGSGGGGYSGVDYAGLGAGLFSAAMSQPRRVSRPSRMAQRPVEKSVSLSVAEFKCAPPEDRIKPWTLKAEMEKKDGSVIPYEFILYLGSLAGEGEAPIIPSADVAWTKIRLTGSDSKLLKR